MARGSSKRKSLKAKIKKLPEVFERSLKATTKKSALEFKKTFEDGIKRNQLRLKRLSLITIDDKKDRGYRAPKTPLFGKGDFAGMLIVKRLKYSWKVEPRPGKHHSGLSFKDILTIHAEGRTINIGRALIRIPPRPAFSRAYALYLRRIKKKEKNREVWKAINQMIAKNKADVEARYK